VVSATDGDVRHAKTKLYNATARRGEVLARSLRVESTAALAVARRIRPLLTVCGLPCWDLSVLGSGVGVLSGPTAAYNKFAEAGHRCRVETDQPYRRPTTTLSTSSLPASLD
jgi:hypothetical protein